MERTKNNLGIFILGGIGYIIIELLFRGYTHWTMFIAGGAVFLMLHKLNIEYPSLSLWRKCILGSLVITSVELLVGCIANLWFHWNVWDYSNNRFNMWGQICLSFSILWGLLCIPIYGVLGIIRGRDLDRS